MTSSTLTNWQPPSGELVWVRPVQVEDASGGLTACSLTDGRAIVMWPLGGDVRYAIVDNMAALLTNDVVDSGDIDTALTASMIHRTTVFTTGGNLYFVALGDDDPTNKFWIRVYVANSASNPTSWSLQGEVQDSTQYDMLDFGGAVQCGVPLILGSGRWVLSATDAYRDTGLGGFVGRDSSFWYSDDNGATWTLTDTFFRSAPAHWAHFSAPQIAEDPATGDLLSAAVSGPNLTDTVVSGNGDSWSFGAHTGVNQEPFFPFLDNGTDVFGVNAFDPEGGIYRLVGSTWTHEVDIWPNVELGEFYDANSEGETAKFVVDRQALWLFVGEYVARSTLGWFVGFVGSRS